MANWKHLIEARLEGHGESWKDVIANTLSQEEMLEEFDDGYGGTEGRSFTLWTAKRVYFPICYDGAEWVGSAPRNPCDEKCEHQGGG